MKHLATPEDGVLAPARAVAAPEANRFVVLVANAKGGCGKTTISTNLAGYYARHGQGVSLLDLDPQQSSGQWLQQRARSGLQDIHVPAPPSRPLGYGRLMATAREASDYLVIDSPAGLEGGDLDALLRLAQVVLVPVLPSPIDIRAATRFVQAVMLSPIYRHRPRRLAVVANRARERTRMYAQLEHFLHSLKIPFLATLRDTQHYVQAAGLGLSLVEMEETGLDADRRTWRLLVDWLEVQRQLLRTLPPQ